MTPDSPTPIQACLNRLKAGDALAREDLFLAARERLLVMIRAMLTRFRALRRWEDSDDVLQNVVIRLDRALRQIPLDTTRDFLAIAAANIRRELIDLMRHYFGPEGHGKHHATPPAGSDSPEPVAFAENDDPAQLHKWTELHESIANLTDDERVVFELRWYMGLTLQEVAETLDVSLRTATRRWVAAKLTLARTLGTDWLAE